MFSILAFNQSETAETFLAVIVLVFIFFVCLLAFWVKKGVTSFLAQPGGVSQPIMRRKQSSDSDAAKESRLVKAFWIIGFVLVLNTLLLVPVFAVSIKFLILEKNILRAVKDLDKAFKEDIPYRPSPKRP